MAKKFEFDDENEKREEEVFEQPSRIDELEEMKEDVFSDDDQDEETEDFDGEDVEPMSKKKKKKFTWKWWHFVLIGFAVLLIAFIVYIFALSDNDGPVYGSRCEGVTEVSKDLLTAASDTTKTKHSEVESIDMAIECRQLKVDIVFKAGMDTKKAQTIAEEAVQTLDGLVGKPKEDGKTYSTLFSKINNVSQLEVNLYLTSKDSADFPIYGTKHIQNDTFAYTLASVKDETSKNAAESTKTQEKK